MLLVDDNKQFYLDDFQTKSELAMDSKRNKAFKKRQLYNNSQN
jgi:hypothetical protein